MSPALGMHPGMTPHLQQLQAHLLRSAAAAALLPHAHPLQPPPPQTQAQHPHTHSHSHPHSHPHVHTTHGHSHNLSPHSQLFPVSPHSTGTAVIGNHAGGIPTKNEVSYLHLAVLNIYTTPQIPSSFSVNVNRSLSAFYLAINTAW